MSSTLRFDPEVIDRMKLYTAIVYIRRLKKAGYLGDKDKDESGVKKGTAQDFMKLFGNNPINGT